VNEVLSDLDLQKLMWVAAAESPVVASTFKAKSAPVSAEVEAETHSEITSAAEAAAYMQQVALKLRNWRESMDKAAVGARGTRR